ncbi:hypothetical protein BT63DRAFT_280640 [Microthyrium microscopicum]|uniref:Uncharacterized protein n=1 Tax=Microthyrium microscopicum TaxID=703497 RepID=A0A6A6UAF0_9PEZI|nr:hypothetical protein BT63DRAFT_280640 [Microthyrium microscopicum]
MVTTMSCAEAEDVYHTPGIARMGRICHDAKDVIRCPFIEGSELVPPRAADVEMEAVNMGSFPGTEGAGSGLVLEQSSMEVGGLDMSAFPFTEGADWVLQQQFQPSWPNEGVPMAMDPMMFEASSQDMSLPSMAGSTDPGLDSGDSAPYSADSLLDPDFVDNALAYLQED